MASPPGRPKPGWYPDPRESGLRRYWDGREWTSHVSPAESEGEAPWRYRGPRPRSNNLVIAGWVTAFLFPPAGIVVAIGLLRRNERAQAYAIGAVAAAVLVVVLVAT
jgi:hypothetical protein